MNSVCKEGENSNKALAIASNKRLSAIGNNQCRHYIVLTRSRTGSNLLISLLNSHPNIHADGEVFAKLNGIHYREVLARTFSKHTHSVKAKGFKIFYYHPMDDYSCGIWNELQSSDDLYVIHLKRTNILSTVLSRKIAGIQDVWSVNSNQHLNSCREQISVSFTVDELNNLFKQTRRWENDGDKRFRNHPLLTVDYEELVNDRITAFHKVTEFLGVQYVQPKTELIKQNTRSLREAITNYDELKSAFAETEWGLFFKD